MKNKYYYKCNNKIKIGYAIFRYHNNKLWALTCSRFEVFYSTINCCIFDELPIMYFDPNEGDFIIKTTRQYPDLEILKYTGINSNYTFKAK